MRGQSGNSDARLLNWHTITVPAGTSGTLFTATAFNPTLSPDVLNFVVNGTVYPPSNMCKKPCAFIAGVQQLGAGQVQILDSISGHNQLLYAFGDGSFGNSADPIHAYSAPGGYNLTLIATNECGSDTSTYPVEPCRSAVMNMPPSGCVGLATTFVQTTAFPSGSIEWLVNGVSVGSGNSYTLMPTAVGTYQVSIILHESPCHDTTTQAFIVSGTAPLAAFTFNPGSNNTVYFTNLSSNANSYLWDFGDGQTSTATHPSHVYANSGTFTICLTATNTCGSVQQCSTWTCTFPVANFTYSLSASTITCQSTATGANGITWSFGDGGTATGANVSHAYANSGTYTVCQYATSACATDTFCTNVAMVTNGNVFWRRNYTGLGTAIPRGSATNANGQTVIVGAGTSQEFVLVIDSTGAELAELSFPSSSYLLNDACVTPSGNFIVVGGTTAAGPAQMNGFCMEVSPSGSIVNQTVIGGANAEAFATAHPLRYGGYFLTGYSGTMYAKVDANLQVVWNRQGTLAAVAGFQAADSSYWMVRQGALNWEVVHLDKTNGLEFEGWRTPNLDIQAGGTALMDCNGMIHLMFRIQDFYLGAGNVNDLGLLSFNTNTHAGQYRTLALNQNTSFPPTHELFPHDLAMRPDGNLIGVGEVYPRGNPNASPRREQWVANINPTNLSMTMYAAGTNATQDRLAAVSVLPNGSFLTAGDVDGALEMRKFYSSTDCRVGSFFFISLMQNTAGSTFTAFTPSPGVTYGGQYSISATPQVLPGQGTLACHAPCSTLVNVAFTVTQSGNTITLTSISTPGANLNWSVPGQSCLIGNPVSFTVPNCNTPPFTVTLTASNGCDMDTETQTITPLGGITNPFSLTTLIRDTVRCGTSPVTLTAPSGYSAYLWSNGATTPSTSITGTGQVTVRVLSPSGCYYTDTATVSQGSITAPALGANFSHCPGTNANLNAGAGYAAYLWSTGATTQTITVAGAGTFSVTVTAANGCTAADTITVGLHPQPNANLGPDRTICPGTTTNLNPGGGFTSYLWSTGAFSSSINVSNPGTYRVTVTNSNGCADADTIVISQWTVAPMSAGPSQSICPGNGATFTASAGFVSYLWNKGATTASITVAAPGTYSVTGTDSHGCTASSSTTLILLPAPTASLGPDATICPGGLANIGPGPGFASYLWSNGATTSSITVTAGTYSVTVSNVSGCVDADTIVIGQYSMAQLTVTNPQTICPGDTAAITASPGFLTYQWNNGA
ncbi:MAG: PKD domain-containing protein [Bacteroidia bacterium]